MTSSSAWAVEIERMSSRDRAHTGKFHPYCVSPDGSLQLPLEIPRLNGPRQWPTGASPGWAELTVPGEGTYSVWRPLHSEFYFGQQDVPVRVCVSPEDRSRIDWTNGHEELLRLIASGRAFPFCGYVFVLPDWEKFVMNSFRYDVGKKDALSVFVGYRGQSKRYEEKFTPGLYRKGSDPLRAKQWQVRSRIAGNVLKQRFLEQRNEPLTEMEAIGILQHHYIIGPTDLVDFSHDVSIAKWFALNERVNGTYRRKKFLCSDRRDADRETCYVYTVAVRAIGNTTLSPEEAKPFTSGVVFRWWEDFGSKEGSPQPEVPPYNLAPLWSEYPRWQKGFGLRGVRSGDVDVYGSILSVTEHAFHPRFRKDGWDRIGGPELSIDGQRFGCGEDSSCMTKFLFPELPRWFKDVISEIEKLVR